MESKSVKEVAETTGLSEEQVKRKYPFSFGQVKPVEGTFKEGMAQAVDLGTDVAPIVGTAKAVADLPEDAELIKQLVAAGYEEGDIKKMGLGGAYTALTVAGLIPGAKVAADIAKKGIKEGVEGAVEETATQTARALNVATEKSPLRTLYDDLPETERAMLPEQPDEYGLYGYHGTAGAREADESFFDINFARTNDQFLGEGFYFTLDPAIASEYASLRSIGRNFEKTIKGDAARKILTTPNVQKQFIGGLGKDVSVHVTPGGDYVTVGSIMKGKNIYGEDIAQGQYVSRFNLSNLKKPYVVRTEKQRKELKDKIPELKEQGYDSVLFADFKDRSKQIMVFPEHMDKIDTSSIAGRSASASLKDADALEIGINPAMKEGVLLRKYDASTVNSMVENASAANAGTKAANKLIGAEVADGTQVGIRLNLNSTIPNMPKGLDKLQTLHQKNYNGKALSYRPFATVENVTFNVNQKGRQGIAAKIKGVDVPEAKNKFPAMSVDGQLNNTRNILDEIDDDVIEIGFNPMSGHLFVDMSTGQAIQSADVATVVGDRIYAKGVTYMKKAEAPDPLSASDGTPLPSEVRYKMKKGGVVPMDRQMEMFQDGGLEQDGGTNDPVSGNEVPPGSSQEEVRDDIPAQLSEGEFVFPADVVRFIGLNKLMQMRQEAKMGLKMMEEMGQMGNSEEATMPDDLPFGVADLVIVDGKEGVDNDEPREYNVGGIVYGNQPAAQNTGVVYQQPMFQAGQTQVGQAAAPIQMAPIARPEQQQVPVYQPPETLPSPAEFTAAPEGQAPQTITIVNQETGEERQITFIPGVTELPQGFVRKEDYVPKEVVPETATTRVGTATVTERDTSEADERRRKEEEKMYGPGGGRVGVAGRIYGVSFDMPEGFMPGMAGLAGTALGLASGKPLPENVTVNFKRGDTEFAVTGAEYNKFKTIAQSQGYNSDEAENALDEMREAALERKAEKEKAEAEAARQAKLVAIEAAKAAATEAARKKAEEERRKQEQIEQERLRQLSETNINRLYGDSSDRDESQQRAAEQQREADSFTREAVRDVADRVSSGRGFAEGGLAAKKKPKAKKQMKRGGLASKK